MDNDTYVVAKIWLTRFKQHKADLKDSKILSHNAKVYLAAIVAELENTVKELDSSNG